MPQILEADVGLIHIAGGGLRSTPPPGTLARSAPRRAARGRQQDLLFLTLHAEQAQPPAHGALERLSDLAAEAYFHTPGTVTSALRAASETVNGSITQPSTPAVPGPSHLLLGVLRGADFYLAQVGRAEAVLLRSGQINRFGSAEAADRPLASAATPFVRYHHLNVHSGDLLLLVAGVSEAWSDPVLKAVSGFEPAQAIEQLSHSRQQDTRGLLLRLVPEGEAAPPPTQAEPVAAEGVRQRPAKAASGRSMTATLAAAYRLLSPALNRLRAVALRLAAWITRGLVRLAPGVLEPPRPGEFSPALLAATAVLIPLLVLALVSIVYFRRGRTQQFQAYVQEARTAIAAAQTEADSPRAREQWTLADYWLDQASQFGQDADWLALDEQVQQALDELDLVSRLVFNPLVAGGFGRNAQLTHIAATRSDVYLLDSANTTLWHTWGTGRGYEIDRDFDCLAGPDTITGMGTPVDMAVQPEPGALGAEGVVALDADGTLLYCAPDRRPLTGQITPPDTGFGQIQAIDVFGNTLYVLDPQANAIWLYDATGGVFSGNAALYFVDEVPDLSQAIDIAKSQEELFILHRDGSLDQCLRTQEGSGPITVACEQDLRFRDERDAAAESATIPEAVVVELTYSPPPEPSLFFLDSQSRSVFRYSVRMVYQGQIQPLDPLPEEVTALGLGPPNDLFIAAGDNVYYTQLR